MILFVRTNDLDAQQRVIRDLEARAFTAEGGDKALILGSRFPLRIDLSKKTYGAMGNVTCAAAAASSGCLMTVEEFYAKALDPE